MADHPFDHVTVPVRPTNEREPIEERYQWLIVEE